MVVMKWKRERIMNNLREFYLNLHKNTNSYEMEDRKKHRRNN